MNVADDDDAQRKLEQRALRNVHSLASRLGYADAVDRYGEKVILKAIGGLVVVVVTGVAIALALPAEDPGARDKQSCRLTTGVVVVDEMRADLKARQPQLTKADLERRVTVMHKDVKQEASRRCEAQGR